MVLVFEEVNAVPAENHPVQMFKGDFFTNWSPVHIQMAVVTQGREENLAADDVESCMLWLHVSSSKNDLIWRLASFLSNPDVLYVISFSYSFVGEFLVSYLA